MSTFEWGVVGLLVLLGVHWGGSFFRCWVELECCSFTVLCEQSREQGGHIPLLLQKIYGKSFKVKNKNIHKIQSFFTKRLFVFDGGPESQRNAGQDRTGQGGASHSRGRNEACAAGSSHHGPTGGLCTATALR